MGLCGDGVVEELVVPCCEVALGDRIHAIEKEQTRYHVIGAVVLALVIILTANWLGDIITPAPP